MRAALLLAAASAPLTLHAIPAFPGAEGFGAEAVGGRGGSVYIVTNLNDSGPGSFRDAVSQPNRTVVFAVGGVIRIVERIAIQPNITIAGQTAPGEGITIYGNGVSFSNASNTICRFIRFRQGIGGSSGTDAVGIASGSNMIFDHVSASWGRDETFSVTGSAANITLQDCIVGQGLLIHSAGGLMEPSGAVSVFRTLYADNWMRNPKVKGIHEFTNNVIYNWGSGGAYICGDSAGQSYPNIINNLFIAGVNSGTTPAFIRGNLNFHAYAAGNMQDATPDGALSPVLVHPNDFTIVDAQPVAHPYPTVATLLDAAGSLEHVTLHAGASLHRDSVDAGMVAEVLSFGTLGRQIENENEVGGVGEVMGGPAPLDADSDGMPDWWELAAGLDPATPDAGGDADADGYTNIENYINAIAFAGIQGAAITHILDDTGAIADDANTADTTLILGGTAWPGSTVTLRRMGAGVIGSTTADGAGNWTFDATATSLPDNYYVFFASASSGGTESQLSRGFVVRVDTTAAEAPVITSMVMTPDVVFNGTAEPGVSVAVRFEGGAIVATATADAAGSWSAAYTGPALDPAVYAFVASAVDLAGNPGPESDTYTVDTGLAAPVFTGITSDSGYAADDQITNDTSLVIQGTAPAGSTVSVSRSGTVGVVGTAEADASGNWVLDTTGTTLPQGTYTFSATASVGGTSSPASAPFVVVVDTSRPTIPSLVRHDPATAATSSDTLIFRVTMSEPVVDVDVTDFSITRSPASITGTISAVTQVSPSVYDVVVTGVSGDGTLRLDRPSSARISDYAGNTTNSGFTGGQSYTLRLPGSGVWSNSLGDGVWSDATNWEAGVVANGDGATGDFGSLEITEDLTVHLDSPRTIGRLVFGDADIDTAATWTLDDSGNAANVLTMASVSAPTIQVNHSGTTGQSDAVIAAASAAVPATIDVVLTGTQGLTKTGKGTALLTRPVEITGPLALTTSGGYLTLGPGSSYEAESATIGTSAQLQVAGGSFTTPGTITIANGGQSGVQVYDGTATIAEIRTTGDRDGVVRVTGGTANIGSLSFGRTSNSEGEAANFGRAGLIIQGGSTTIGTLTIASGNSWSGASIEGGELTVTGSATFANQVTSGRGALLRVTGGRFTVPDEVDGLVLSKKNGANANNVAKVTLSGGVTTLGKLTLGFDNTVTAGSVSVTLAGGELYLGQGGLEKRGTATMATAVTLESGILGAMGDWSTAHPLALAGAVDLRAADEAGIGRIITLDGVISGSGTVTKSGAGTLRLNAQNTFDGATVVTAGRLELDGSVAGHVQVLAGAAIAGAGTISGDLLLDAGSSLAADPFAPNLLSITGALTSSDVGVRTVAVNPSAPMNVGATYALAQFGSTTLTDADFALAPVPGYLGVVQVGSDALSLLVTGAGATAEFTHWAYLNALPPGLDGPNDNPAGDGIPNLLKFVLALDPNQASAEGIAATTVEEAGATYPAIVYTRRKALGGVTADVLVAPDLGFTTLLGVVEVSASDNGDGTETVVTRSAVTTAQQPRQFFRIAATLPDAP